MAFRDWPLTRYARASQWCGLATLLVGGVALTGWFTGSRVLSGIRPQYIPMAPNTALGFVLLGVALSALYCWTMWARRLAYATAGLTLLMVGARLAEYVSPLHFDVDRWFFSFPSENLGLAPVGKMAFFTSLNFLFASVALILLVSPNRRRTTNDVARVLACVVTFVGLVFALGYLYEAPLLYGTRSIPMALNTAVASFLLGFGLTVRASLREVAERRRDHEALQQAHDELEMRVHERTAQLAASEERYRLVSRATNEVVWDWDVRTDAVVCSEAVRTVFGHDVDPAKLDAQWWTELLHPDDRDRVARSVSTAFESGASTWSDQFRLRRGDGTYAVVLDRGTVLRDAEGPPTRMIGSLMDVTDRVRAEDEIRRINADLEERVARRTAQLETANRELESFCYAVSHDLRAPLRSIKGFTQVLLEDYGDRLEAEAQGNMNRICTATNRMSQLIDDLLELSRVTRADLRCEPVDMSVIARRVIERLREEDPGRAVDFQVPDALPAHGDDRLLEVVLENLLGNAWKFTRHCSRARIELDALAPNSANGAGNGKRVYCVRDNGVGFDMAYADKLFAPFQRLHATAEFQGTGIGLATVHRIVLRHGGRIWAEAGVDQGAVFYFTL